MPKATFFPIGNADTVLLDLIHGKKVLFDYANTRDPDNKYDPRCDLEKELRDDLENADRDHYDVVAFTHLDKDHYQRASEFFWLEHAKKYQGGRRIKISTLWVPAALITEDGVEDDEGRIIQAEARYRFKNGAGIRVFSRPDRLRKWCERNGINIEDRLGLLTDAGKVAPEFSLEADGVEFFVHSPFAKRLDDKVLVDRNECSLVMQATFIVDGVETKMILASDTVHDVLADIVNITKAKGNEERLEWDIYKLPHHCSYLSLGPEKGNDQTSPIAEAAWLYEEQQQENAIIVSTSEPIPAKGSVEDKDDYPPHRQAANYYKSVVDDPDNQFLVTMQHPSKASPRPLVIEIGVGKATVVKRAISAAVAVTSRSAPRAG
nr:hypothetical protein [Nitrosomonas nitrosa]